MTAPATPAKCACCGQAPDDRGLTPAGFCAPCARGQHTQACKPDTKDAALREAKAAKAKPPAAAAPAKAQEPAKTAAPKADEPVKVPPPAVEAEPVAEEEKAIARRPALALPDSPASFAGVQSGSSGLVLRNLEDLWRFAQIVSKSGMVKGFETPEKVAVAVQFGAEVGLSPMQSLANVAVIGGRAGLHSDAPLALVRASGLLEDFDEWFEHNGERVATWPKEPTDETASFCLVKRKGERELVRSFTVHDAKVALLWNKEGPWRAYTGRMMRMKARNGQALRDGFPDILKGLASEDEVIAAGAIETSAVPMPRPKRAEEAAAS